MKSVQSIFLLVVVVSLGARAQQNDGRGLGVDSLIRESKKEVFHGVYLEFLDRMTEKNQDSIQDKTLESHGFFGEFMGKNLVYSLGYEYTFQKNKHGMGVGIGASGMKYYAPGKSYPNYTFSLSPFYEYGTRFGPRISLTFAAGINPILSTGKLNYLPYADLPPVVVVMPSGSLGMFYRTRNNRFHFSISGYLIYRYSIYKERKSSRLSPWVGCSVKYNFKFR